jgi:hypothetical protein
VLESRPALRFSKASAVEEEIPAIIELDGAPSFDSDDLVSEEVTARTLSAWTPPGALTSGSGYHWRVAASSQENLEWRPRTFTIRDDLPFDGWFQQGRQFESNNHGPSLTFSDSAWRLANFNVDARIRSAHFRATALSTIIVGGFEYETLKIGFAGVIVSVDGRVKASGSFIPYPNRRDIDEVAERERLSAFLASAEEDEYVLVNSRFFLQPSDLKDLPDETKEIFRQLGSTQIDSVEMKDLWNFAIRIGDEIPIADVWQPRDPNVGPHILWTDVSLPIQFASGDSKSLLVGPAMKWHEVQATGVVAAEGPSLEVQILDVNDNIIGSETLRKPGGLARIDLSTSGLNIDARKHPFLRLKLVVTDSTRLGTPQLIDWYVGYDPVAELVVDAPAFETVIDTVAEGEPLNVSVNVINGSPTTVDSVFVSYFVTDKDNRSSLSALDTLLNIGPDATVESSASIATKGKPGQNRITITAEQPRGPEPVTFNNTVIGSFRVIPDKTAPIFSLTVDGNSYPTDPRVITTTDDPTLPFFTSHPSFEITVTDENQFLSLIDTTVVSLALDGVSISNSSPEVQFTPGAPPDNQATLIFSPDFSGQDTTHTLKAWAQDASGNSNPTMEEPYVLSFRVQTAAEVENLYPYPNPMHNFTTFMFQLRGADTSFIEDFRIRVYTVSGRPVREFDLLDDPNLLEEGGLRIGWNRMTWDGRDEDGDLLATGVYLYKVFLRAEGREISVNNDSSIEKLAIIR